MSKLLRKLGLKKSTVIDFWDCSKLNLFDLPKEVFRHRQTLKSLSINNNHIRDIPKTIFMIEGLEELDISENDILFIPPAISKLPNLTSLVISKNSLASIPDAIRHCQQLISLDLSINPLGSLCEGVTELRQLRKLILNDTQLEELPPNIGKLSKLEILEIRENMLQTLPGSMSHLTLLEKLDIGNNEFVTMPTVVGSLESLCELWLDSNTINSIPEELGNLHNLRFLEMSENHIMVLPNTVGGWVKLTDLYANENLISMLPDAFGMLSNLRIANLSSNRLGGLPDTVYGLTSLVELDLSHNHITELPNSVGGMTSLVTLNIDENLLSSLPPKIGNCTLLKYFSVRDNQLCDVPPECGFLTQLRILNVVGNRLSHLPYTLIGLKHLSAIWVSENQSRPIVELQVEKGDRRDGGEKWLTCFLFPQQGRESPFEEATSPLDVAADEDPVMKSTNRKGSQVNFDIQVLDKRSKLSRDPTPFPKELHNRAMQWRAARDIHPEAESLLVPPSGDHSPQPEDVTLRHTSRRLVKNRYSLMRAFSDPLDEHLKPVGGYIHDSPPISPPPAHTHKSPSHSPISPGRYSPSANGLIPSSGTGSPLSSAYSPHSSVQPIPPPSGFASSARVPSPVSLSPKLHPSQNGGVAYQQPHLRDAQVIRQEVQFVPHGSPNSNGNNNAHRSRFPDHNISLGKVNQVMGSAEIELELQTPPPLQQQYFPISQVSNLSHPETRSSMESGFDADTEPENQQNPWYNISPNASPKSRRRSRDNRPILGPQVTVPSGHMNPHHIRTSSESRDSHHSGSQMSQHDDSTSDDYERLVFKQPHPQSGRSSTLAEQRRGSLDAVVMLSAKEKSNTFTYGEYQQAYPPSHKPSHSFDVTAHVGVRGHVRRTPPSSHHSQESHHSTRPPIPQSSRPSSRASSGRSRSEKRPHHVRNHSQPEHMAHAVPNSTNSHSQPDSRSPSHTHSRKTSTKSNDSVFHSAYPGHRVVEGRSSSSHNQSKIHHQTHDPRTHNMHKTGRGRFYSDIHSKIVENELYQHNHPRHNSERLRSYPNYASDDSRQSTPVATPTLATRSNYVSGNDSGFDSMNRSNRSPMLSPGNGNQYYVELEKNPTLGLGITGGVGGENAIKPGDQGFHVYKVTEGLPAHQVGVIDVGDRLLEVNGHAVSSMACEDVLSLLTYQDEQTVTLLLSKEPSQTLL